MCLLNILLGSTDHSKDCALTWISSLALTKQDERILLSGGWLSANHIFAVQKLLRKAFPTQEGLNDTGALSERLYWPSKPDKCVQIIHVSGCHWACLSNCFCDSAEIDLYDCLHTIPRENDGVMKQACTILKSEKSFATVNVINVQFQDGSCDCGLFAIAMAFDLCCGRDPFLQNYEQSKMREHLHCCLEKKQLVAFPATSKVVHRQQRIVEKVTTKIYCTCRLPEEPPMAYCESCGTWYHRGCTKIPEEVFTDEDATWICEICTFIWHEILIHMSMHVLLVGGRCESYSNESVVSEGESSASWESFAPSPWVGNKQGTYIM